MRFAKIVSILAVAAAPFTVSLTTASASTTKGGVIQVWQYQNTDTATAPITFTGAIGDYGTATNEDKNGKVDDNGSYVKIVLKKGGFTVNAVALNQKFAKLQPTFNTTTCSGYGSGTAPVTVSAGTGAYAGISGTLNITGTFAFVGPKLANGKCNMANNAPSLSEWTTITGGGTVSF